MRSSPQSRSLGSCIQEEAGQEGTHRSSLASRPLPMLFCPEHPSALVHFTRLPTLTPPQPGERPLPSGSPPSQLPVPEPKSRSLSVPLYAPSFLPGLGLSGHQETFAHSVIEGRGALEAGRLQQGRGGRDMGNLPREESGGLSSSQRTCRGVLETSSPQDMHLGHQLGVAAQGAPARAGRLIQAQLPGTGQRRRGGRSRRGVRKMEDKGVQEVGRGGERSSI